MADRVNCRPFFYKIVSAVKESAPLVKKCYELYKFLLTLSLQFRSPWHATMRPGILSNESKLVMPAVSGVT